jgi:starch synthase (maltosyl-transferring)
MGFNHVASAPLFKPGRNGNLFLTADHETLHPALGIAAPADPAIASLVDECRHHDLGFILDIVIDRVAADAIIRASEPDWFDAAAEHRADTPDPRSPSPSAAFAHACFDRPDVAGMLTHWWIERLIRLSKTGLSGFCCLRPDRVPAAVWQRIISGVRADAPSCRFIAWTPGIARDAIRRLVGVGFDYVGSSVAWWDARASWLVEEADALRQVAPAVASPEPSFAERLASRLDPEADLLTGYRRALHLAAATGSGMLVPMGFEFATRRPFDATRGAPADFERIRQEAACDLSDDIRYANGLTDSVAALRVDGEMRSLTGPGSPVTALLRADTPDVRAAQRAMVVLVNPNLSRSVPCIRLQPPPPEAGAAFGHLRGVNGTADPETPLAQGEVRLFRLDRMPDIRNVIEETGSVPRIVITSVTPTTNDGVSPVKRLQGERVVVNATIFTDGHDELAAELLWRAGSDAWCRVPMRRMANDRWQAEFIPQQVGRHAFTIEAWWDEWGTFRRDLQAKHVAGVDIALEVDEGLKLLRGLAERAGGPAAAAIDPVLHRLGDAGTADRIEILLCQQVRDFATSTTDRAFLTRHTPDTPLDVDRPQAAFASWYELFPRSVSKEQGGHGRFIDVIERLPGIRAMGFDVLYFPPIHPIGVTNRKGRNNSLNVGPDDLGSPYAIGSAEGGHDAVHPALGTLEDFRQLVTAARENGLEIALDYAIQCSPDHPWLREHPDWFRWRSDGTVRYAENPPKKYEDIVNVDFYAASAIPSLWTALRDIVQFWMDQGVRIFRVDNPHTKPLPFWQWLIADIHAGAPDVIFLAEAFTRPAMMYRLAEIGFTQSYTYFTWRNTKQEITEYLTELNAPPVRDFFRPHFFVNTPDINPVFLQSGGRAGFLIRAALAATLSGLWGVYSGFEHCESTPLPGREEYLNSEKYEIRPRAYRASGDIVDEIATLNRIRRAHPALHSHLGLRFYAAFNDHVLLYGKRHPDQDDMILVAVNLDPNRAQESDIEIPLWEWNLSDESSLMAEDLVRERRFIWTGKRQRIRLDPTELPYAIWRLAPSGDAG